MDWTILHLHLLDCIMYTLKLFPFKTFIFRTQQKLGEHHSELVYLLVPQLLSCHPYFDSPEPEMDDPSCILDVLIIHC